MAYAYNNDVVLPSEILQCTPSTRDGVDPLVEIEQRHYGCDRIQRLGVLLRLKPGTILSAQTVLHRFYYRRSLKEFDVRRVTEASVLLACKFQEDIRKIRDIFNCVYILNRREEQHEEEEELSRPRRHQRSSSSSSNSASESRQPEGASAESSPEEAGRSARKPIDPEDVDWVDLYNEQMDIFRQQVTRAERYILRETGFELSSVLVHPHLFAVYYIETLFRNVDTVSSATIERLAQIAWAYCNDSMRTGLCCEVSPEVVAVAVVHLAALRCGMPLTKESRYTEIFEVSWEDVESTAMRILGLYLNLVPTYCRMAPKSGPPRKVKDQQPGSNAEEEEGKTTREEDHPPETVGGSTTKESSVSRTFNKNGSKGGREGRDGKGGGRDLEAVRDRLRGTDLDRSPPRKSGKRRRSPSPTPRQSGLSPSYDHRSRRSRRGGSYHRSRRHRSSSVNRIRDGRDEGRLGMSRSDREARGGRDSRHAVPADTQSEAAAAVRVVSPRRGSGGRDSPPRNRHHREEPRPVSDGASDLYHHPRLAESSDKDGHEDTPMESAQSRSAVNHHRRIITTASPDAAADTAQVVPEASRGTAADARGRSERTLTVNRSLATQAVDEKLVRSGGGRGTSNKTRGEADGTPSEPVSRVVRDVLDKDELMRDLRPAGEVRAGGVEQVGLVALENAGDEHPQEALPEDEKRQESSVKHPAYPNRPSNPVSASHTNPHS